MGGIPSTFFPADISKTFPPPPPLWTFVFSTARLGPSWLCLSTSIQPDFFPLIYNLHAVLHHCHILQGHVHTAAKSSKYAVNFTAFFCTAWTLFVSRASGLALTIWDSSFCVEACSTHSVLQGKHTAYGLLQKRKPPETLKSSSGPFGLRDSCDCIALLAPLVSCCCLLLAVPTPLSLLPTR